MKLKNLKEIAEETVRNINENVLFSEISLSDDFKLKYSEYLTGQNKSISFFDFSAQYGNDEGKIISLPNNWFLIAYYLIDYYKALIEYKTNFDIVFNGLDKSDIAGKLFPLSPDTIPSDISTRINNYFTEPLDQEYFKKFLTDNYHWWSGQKKIDRNDFFLSAILKVANLINDSSSFVGNIVKDLASNISLSDSLMFIKKDFNNKLVVTNESSNINFNGFSRDIKIANLQFSEGLIARFISSLLTKPFVILTGLSGSGKTKLAQAFASWISENDNQYCIVPVGADWTNREPLLGFPNALDTNEYIQPQNGALKLIIDANKNQDKPYFLILDEMNLSHVERYFADFLSAMESKCGIELHTKGDLDSVPRKIELPSNLFIIGTVNIDETTYMFSPKVLDRANVIEFRVTTEEMSTYLNHVGEVNLKTLAAQGSNMAAKFVSLTKQKVASAAGQDEIKEPMLAFFKELKKTGSEFGYRSAAEILRFVSIAQMIKPDWDLKEIFDAAIMQKLLPKVHGSRKKLAPVLESLGNLCLKKDIKIADVFDAKIETDYAAVSLYPISLEKIARMYGNLMDNGFTSYAEA